jgi:hypothetical protein
MTDKIDCRNAKCASPLNASCIAICNPATNPTSRVTPFWPDIDFDLDLTSPVGRARRCLVTG